MEEEQGTKSSKIPKASLHVFEHMTSSHLSLELVESGKSVMSEVQEVGFGMRRAVRL